MSRFTRYKRTLLAINIYHIVGASTLQNLKMMIRQNIIFNLPVTVEDIETSEKIFGADVYTLKGITTKQNPKV